MNFISMIGGILIAGGAAVMAVNILKLRAVSRFLDEFEIEEYGKIKRFFSANRILMFFFFAGYLIVLYCQITNVDIFGDLFVGVIFFLGAVFVLLSIQLQSSMLSSIESRYAQSKADTVALESERLKLLSANEDLEREMDERRRTKEALENSEKRFRNLAETTSDWIWEVDQNTIYTYVSPKVRDILGFEPEEILGKTPFELMPAEEAERVEGLVARVISSKQPIERLENTNLHKNGYPVILETSAVPIFDDNGNFSGYRGIDRDISERKKAEDSQKMAGKQWQNTFDAIKDMVVIVNKDRRVVQMNRACQDFFPFLAAQHRCYELFHGASMLPQACASCSVFTTGESLTDEYYNDHLQKWFDLTAYPITERNGSVEQVVHILKDITEHKRFAAEREKLSAQLQRAEKMQAIGTLAGGVAHDLNNILSGISSYPELILMDLPEDSPLRKPIQTIQKSGHKAAAIVNDLLTLARRGVVVSEVVSLNEVVKGYLKSAEFEGLKSYYPDIKIETHMNPNLLNIIGSHVHLSKTIMNLVSNAAEAINSSGVIRIYTANKYLDRSIKGYDNIEEGDYVLLKVSDNGEGIPPEHIDKIFEPFYSKKKMGRSGTGLGMAVVWGTVMDHRGFIDVQSTVGKGTTVTLYFPVTRKERMTEKAAVAIEKYMAGGESILVVDDVPEQREIASNMLKRMGYHVYTAASGEEAIDYMKNNRVDLLLLDMIMDPGNDGLETYKKIIELHPGQKAIIASGFSENERVKEAQKMGAGQYVKKPYTLEKIAVAVREELLK